MRRWILPLVLLGAACSDAETTGTGGSDGTGAAGGAGGSPQAVDPLGLDQCEGDAAPLSAPVDLPAMNWDTTDASQAYCALRALDETLAGKRILCSGEGDHGVSQSSRWHFLLARYLVHRWNVRVVAYEIPGADMEPWNRYMTSGDPADLEAGFVGSSGTLAGTVDAQLLVEAFREVQLELAEGDRLSLVGFDISVQTKSTLAALDAFLQIVEPAEAEALMDGVRSGTYAERAAAAGALHARIVDNEAAYVAATDQDRWRDARRDAKNLEDGCNFLIHYQAGDFGTGNALYREPGLIRNMEEIAALTPPEQRVFMISHNFHCAKSMPASGAATIEESPALGTHLAMSDTWGPVYAVVGQHYRGGAHLTFQGEDTFESGSLTLDYQVGDMTQAPALMVATSSTWMDFTKSWKVMANGQSGGSILPDDQYDVLLWLREVTASTPR